MTDPYRSLVDYDREEARDAQRDVFSGWGPESRSLAFGEDIPSRSDLEAER